MSVFRDTVSDPDFNGGRCVAVVVGTGLILGLVYIGWQAVKAEHHPYEQAASAMNGFITGDGFNAVDPDKISGNDGKFSVPLSLGKCTVQMEFATPETTTNDRLVVTDTRDYAFATKQNDRVVVQNYADLNDWARTQGQDLCSLIPQVQD